MAVDVKSLILQKTGDRSRKKLTTKDVNRDLLIALLAIPIYGKEARDEEIISVIINAGVPVDKALERMRKRYDQLVAEKKIKKTKDGVRDKDGFYVLVPRR